MDFVNTSGTTNSFQATALTTAVIIRDTSNIDVSSTYDPSTLADLLGKLSLSNQVLDTSTTATGGEGKFTYTLSIPESSLDFLAGGETRSILYTITLNDGESGNDSADTQEYTITVNVTGTNDRPVISIQTGDANIAAAPETNLGITLSDTLTVIDADYSDTVTMTVDGVTTGGTYSGPLPPTTALLSMMGVTTGALQANATVGSSLTWTFASGSEAFDFLGNNETLVLTYTLKATDSSGTGTNTDTETVTITITGTNDAPNIRGNTNLIVNGSFENPDVPGNAFVSPTTIPGWVTGSPSGAREIVDDSFNGTPARRGDQWLDTEGSPGGVDISQVINGVTNGQSYTLTFSVANQVNTPPGTAVEIWFGGVLQQTVKSSDLPAWNDPNGPYRDFSITVMGGADAASNTLRIQGVSVSGNPGYGLALDALRLVADTPVLSSSLTETNVGLETSGTLNVVDPDVIDTVSLTVDSIVVAGVQGGLLEADLKAMLKVTPPTVGANPEGGRNINWSFDSGSEAFNFLADGETLELSYTIKATDGTLSDTQVVTITITGTNDLPVITGGPVTETLADVAEAGTVPPTADAGSLITSGSIAFNDADISDSNHTALMVPSVPTGTTTGFQGNAASYLTLTPANTATAAAGTLGWSFSAPETDFDYLAAGETLTLAYTVTVSDEAGASNPQIITITVNGANDGVFITGTPDLSGGVTEIADLAAGENATLLSSAGTIDFADVDLTDMHSINSIAAPVITTSAGLTAPSAPLGTFSATITMAVAGTGWGVVTWDFSVSDVAVDYLGAGEVITQTYTVVINDNEGSTVSKDVVVTITGTNDAPVISTVNLVTNGSFETPEVTSGNGYDLANPLDSWTVATTSAPLEVIEQPYLGLVAKDGDQWLDTQASPGGIDISQVLTLNTGENYTLSFWVQGQGDTATNLEVYFGGSSTPVTIVLGSSLTSGSYTQFTATIVGGSNNTLRFVGTGSSNTGLGLDAVSVTSSTTGAIIELADLSVTPAELTTELTQSGTINFADVDLTDTHTPTVSATVGIAVAGGAIAPALPLGNLTVTLDNDSTGDGTGAIKWSYKVLDSALDFLAEGETVTQTYTVEIKDDSNAGNATVTKTVVITLTGTNDKPVITGTDITGEVTEDTATATDNPNTATQETGAFLVDTGTVAFTDADDTDVLSSMVSLNSTAIATSDPLSIVPPALTTALGTAMKLTQTGTNDGSIVWSFAIDNSLTQFLADGETVTATYRISVTDDSGTGTATAFKDVTVTITGTNDAPLIRASSSAVAIQDGDFEAVDLTSDGLGGPVNETGIGNYSVGNVGGWVYTTTSGDGGAYAPTSPPIAATPGTDVGYLNSGATFTSAPISNVEAGQVYKLSIDVGRRIDIPTGVNTTITIKAGADVVGTLLLNTSPVPTAGSFSTFTLATTALTEAQAAAGLTIVLSNAGGGDQVLFDNAKLERVGDFVGAALESNGALVVEGTLNVVDTDLTDKVTLSANAADVVIGGSAVATATPLLTQIDLKAMFEVSPAAPATVDADDTAGSNFAWTFNSGSQAFDFLAAGETLTLTYTIKATDNSGVALGNSDLQAVTVTITGTNDAPVITGTATAGAAAETDTTITTQGTLTVVDLDVTNTVAITVDSVAIDASSTFLPANVPVSLTNAILKGMMDVAGASALAADPTAGSNFTWNFTSGSSGDTAFNFLNDGKTLVLNYTLKATDTSAGIDTQVVTVTITGTNDKPVITGGATTGLVWEDGDLDRVVEAGSNPSATNGFEPLQNTDSYVAGQLNLVAGPAPTVPTYDMGLVLTNVLGQLQTLATMRDAFAQVWDYLDDLYVTFGPSNEPINQAFVYLGIEYAEYLKAGGQPLTDIMVKYAPDGGDAGTNPDRLQSMHDNLLGNLSDAALDDRGWNSGAIRTQIDADMTSAGVFNVQNRVTYSGNETDTGGTAAKAFDVANGYLPAASGQLIATDADFGETATLAWSATGPTTYGTFAIDEATGAWTYTINNSLTATQNLAEGEIVTQDYLVTVTDGFVGSNATTTVTITIKGSNDLPVITTGDFVGAVTELLVPTDNLTDTGTFAFSDVDLTDTHTASTALVSANWTTSNGATPTDPVPAAALLALKNALTLTPVVTDDTPADGAGTVTWTFSVPASAAEFLAVGEKITVIYNVTLTDENGATDVEPVTIVITGTNDKPVIGTIATPTTIVEANDLGQPDGVPITDVFNAANYYIQTGTIPFSDVDISDNNHTFPTPTVVITGADSGITNAAALNMLSLSPTGFEVTPPLGNLGTTQTGVNGVNGTAQWRFLSTHSAFDYLNDGETVTLTYSIVANDNRGSNNLSDAQTLTITITGRNELIVGTGFDDVINQADSSPIVAGDLTTQFGDDIDAGAGDDFVIAAAGPDDIVAGLGNDTVDGGTGNDFIIGDVGNVGVLAEASGNANDTVGGDDSLSGGAGNDTIYGQGGDDEIDGGSNDDSLDGGSGADIIRGGSGNDMIVAGAGDEIDGGTGSDTITVAGSWIDYNINLNLDGTVTFTGRSTAPTGIAGESFTVKSVERVNFANDYEADYAVAVAIDDKPVIVDLLANKTVAENSDNGTLVDTFSVSDFDLSAIPAPGDSLSVTLLTGGTPFKLNGTGVGPYELVVDGSLNRETVSSYTLVIEVKDAKGGTATQAITVNIGDVNDVAPVITNASTLAVVSENGGSMPLFTITTTDVDLVNGTKSYILSGADSGKFDIDQNTGVLTFLGANFESGSASGDDIYSVGVAVKDGVNTSDITTFEVDVRNVNEAPTIAAPVGPMLTVAEDSTVTITRAQLDALVGDAELDDMQSGAAVTLSVIVTTSTGVPVYSQSGYNLASGGDVIFTPPKDYNGILNVTLTATDQGGLTTSRTVQVNVTPTNDAPVVSGPIAASAIEDGAAVTIDGRANATDIDVGDTLTVVPPGSLPAGITFSGNMITLDPTHAAYNGLKAGQTQVVTVTYGVKDGSVTVPATVNFTVTGTNDAPVAGVAAVIPDIAEDSGAVAISATQLLANATDVDGDALSVQNLTVSSGTIVQTSPGNWSYTPAADFKGPVTFSYQVSDGTVHVAKTAMMTVSPVNDAPVVTGPVTASALEGGSSVTVSALAHASDIDGDLLDIVVTGSLPAGVTVNALTAEITLDPKDIAYNSLAAGEMQVVTVTYNVIDNNGGIVPTSASFTVTGTNDAPVVSAAVVVPGILEDALPITITAAQLLSTASDVDGDTLTVTGLTVPAAQGSLVDNGGGVWTFTPTANFNGTATFSYTVTDGTASVNNTATLQITPVNDAPVAKDMVVAGSIAEGAAPLAGTFGVGPLLAIANFATDVDTTLTSASFSFTGATINGNAAATAAAAGITYDSATGAFSFDPTVAAYNGMTTGDTATVVVTFTVTDGTLSDTGTITFTVTGTNDLPVASTTGNSITGNEDTLILGALPLGMDVETDAGALTYELVDPVPGLTLNANGSFSYQGAANSNGPTTFQYRVVDGDGGKSDATTTYTINVTPVNDAPVAASGVTASGTENAVTITGSVSGTDIDNDTLNYTTIGTVPAGLVLNSDGTFIYTVPASDQGLDDGESRVVSFQYVANDGIVNSAPQTVTVTVTGVNDAAIVEGAGTGAGTAIDPDTLTDSVSVTAGTVGATGLLLGRFTATDVDGDALSITTNGTRFEVVEETPGNYQLRALAGATFEQFEGEVKVDVTVGDGTTFVTRTFTLGEPAGGNTAASVNEDVPVSSVVGTAETPIGFTSPTFAFAQPNTKFAINGSTGAITLLSALDFEDVAIHTFDIVITSPEGSITTPFTLTVINAQDTVTGTSGADTLVVLSSTRETTMNGLQGDDSLTGGIRDDILSGGEGNDTLVGGVGKDRMDGGADFDMVSYANSTDGEVISLETGTGNGPQSTGDRFISIEGAIGSIRDDAFYGDEYRNRFEMGAGADAAFGHGGDDTLVGGTGSDTLVGGEGKDSLLGGDDTDLLIGGAGDDTLDAGTGDDNWLTGGAGNDVLVGGVDRDALFGDDDNDMLSGNDGADTLIGGNGNDSLSGGADVDVLWGGEGNDTLDAGTGQGNYLLGEAGDDSLNGGSDVDIMVGGIGNDTINGGGDTDALFGDAGADVLSGGAGSDWLFGGADGDVLNGGEGADVIYGEAGNDTLDGGTGGDWLFGGAGSDTFIFEKGVSGTAVIGDFEAGAAAVDVLRILNSSFGSAQDVIDASVDVGGFLAIQIDATSAIYLQGITKSQLNVNDISLI